MFNPRPGQAEVAKYSGGMMGVSAVPGSGKTHTLSFLASRLIASERLDQDAEVLIVTLVNSAVDIFSSRVVGFLKDTNLIAGVGYRVRTLHGMAYDIVREHPDRIGLDNRFSIIDEPGSLNILDRLVRNWIHGNQEVLRSLTGEEFQFESYIGRWQETLKTIGVNFIKKSKDLLLSPELIREGIKNSGTQDPILNFACELYIEYQESLRQRGAVDFSDLIQYAHLVLMADPEFKARLQTRWQFILEDEAQDSSILQEQLLRILAQKSANWVRVGDPNQAIFETFTTANPSLLLSFLEESDVECVNLKHSGRSTKSIIDLANYLISWTITGHPAEELRSALTEPYIYPTPPGDPQQNPSDESSMIFLVNRAYSPEEELKAIASSLKKWMAENQEKTVAVLVPRNARGAKLIEIFARNNIPYVERMRSSKSTRDVAKILASLLSFFEHPNNHRRFEESILKMVARMACEHQDSNNDLEIVKSLIEESSPEIFFDARFDRNSFQSQDEEISFQGLFHNALSLLSKWQYATVLPIDQLIMTISMDLFSDPGDLALAHKLAVQLGLLQNFNPDWEIPDFLGQLQQIANNQVSVFGVAEDDFSFNPDSHPGEVLVTTYHKAKGLEWDRVYLMSVNNYNFPSLQEIDSYISERWFIRDNLNLEAELLGHLDDLKENGQFKKNKVEGIATLASRVEYCAERLRLLFVGITRARKELVITWNTGKRNNCVEALPLTALREWQECKNHD